MRRMSVMVFWTPAATVPVYLVAQGRGVAGPVVVEAKPAVEVKPVVKAKAGVEVKPVVEAKALKAVQKVHLPGLMADQVVAETKWLNPTSTAVII